MLGLRVSLGAYSCVRKHDREVYRVHRGGMHIGLRLSNHRRLKTIQQHQRHRADYRPNQIESHTHRM